MKTTTLLFKPIALLGLWLATSLAHASGQISYNYVQLIYFDIDYDDVSFGADGVEMSGSALLSDQVYATASLARAETDRFTNTLNQQGSVEMDGLSLGLGFRQPLADNTDLNIKAAFLRSKMKTKGGFSSASDSDNGHGFSVGLRHLVNQRFELNLSGNYTDIWDDSDTSIGVAALVHFTSRFTAGMGYSISSDADTLSLGLRMSL